VLKGLWSYDLIALYESIYYPRERNTGQYLKFNRSDFKNSSSFFVTWPLNVLPNHVWQVIFLSLCDLYQTWYTGSPRWEMHNSMTLTRIQGQGQGHRDPKFAKSPKFKVYLLCQNFLNPKTDGRFLHYRTVSKIQPVKFLKFVLVFRHVTSERPS